MLHKPCYYSADDFTVQYRAENILASLYYRNHDCW